MGKPLSLAHLHTDFLERDKNNNGGGSVCLLISLGILLLVTAADAFLYSHYYFLSKDCEAAANSQETACVNEKTRMKKVVHELHMIKLHVSCRLQGFPLKAGTLIWSCLSTFVIQKKVCIRPIWGALMMAVLFLGFGSSPAPWWLRMSWQTRLPPIYCIVWWHSLWHEKDNSSGQAGQTQ